MIDAILTNTMLPAISGAFLNRLLEGEAISACMSVSQNSEFTYAIA